MSDDDAAAGEGFACWFCPTCQTLTLLSAALANRCCQDPRRADCPLPFPEVRRADG